MAFEGHLIHFFLLSPGWMIALQSFL